MRYVLLALLSCFPVVCQQQTTSVSAHLKEAAEAAYKYVPGEPSAENRANLAKAMSEYQAVLQLDPANQEAISSLARLIYFEASILNPGDARMQKLNDSRDWYRKLAGIDPGNKQAYYMQGLIAWTEWFPAYVEARKSLGLRPTQPGPFPDSESKQQLIRQYQSIVADGIANLRKALDIDPKDSDAMSYLNLLLRESADLRPTTAEYQQDTAEADRLVRLAIEIKRRQSEPYNNGPGQAVGSVSSIIPPPPSPRRSDTFAPDGIKITDQVAEANLINKVEPIYPALARSARVQGYVVFTIAIGKEGTVENLRLVRGHPLLVNAAKEAVLQWTYKPTLLNGAPVEVITQVTVPFSLPFVP